MCPSASSRGRRSAKSCPIGQSARLSGRAVYDRLGAGGGALRRSVKHPGLLVAPAAEAAGVTLLHDDEDHEQIAAITGRPTRRPAPEASPR